MDEDICRAPAKGYKDSEKAIEELRKREKELFKLGIMDIDTYNVEGFKQKEQQYLNKQKNRSKL